MSAQWEQVEVGQSEGGLSDRPIIIGVIIVALFLSAVFYFAIKQENVERQEQLEAVP